MKVKGSIMARRRTSKITKPNDGMNKPKMKAFRTTNEIDELLALVENASEFIEISLLREFSKWMQVTCPTCKGKGKIGHRKGRLRRVG